MGKIFGYLLILGALVVEVPRFAAAFEALDDPVLGMPLTAVGTAFLLSGGSMYVFHTWWKSKRNLRNWLLVPFGVNMALAALILIPWANAKLGGFPLAGSAPWWWVPAVMLSPFVMAGGVTTALAFQKVKQKDRATKTKPKQAEQEFQMDGTDQFIVQARSEQPPVPYQTIADAVGMPKSTVYGRAKVLEREGVMGGNHRGIS